MEENHIILNFSYLLYDAALLGNWHSTFRNTLLISYSNVDNIKKSSHHQVVFVIILRKVDNKLPGLTASHISSRDNECS